MQTDDNGRGPLIPQDRKDNGNEDLCNPPGRGTGPLTWNTGYKYVDGFLWFNNPGNSDGPCGVGASAGVTVLGPVRGRSGAARHQKVTGPHFNLLTSNIHV